MKLRLATPNRMTRTDWRVLVVLPYVTENGTELMVEGCGTTAEAARADLQKQIELFEDVARLGRFGGGMSTE
jgi:hypothetical protein